MTKNECCFISGSINCPLTNKVYDVHLVGIPWENLVYRDDATVFLKNLSRSFQQNIAAYKYINDALFIAPNLGELTENKSTLIGYFELQASQTHKYAKLITCENATAELHPIPAEFGISQTLKEILAIPDFHTFLDPIRSLAPQTQIWNLLASLVQVQSVPQNVRKELALCLVSEPPIYYRLSREDGRLVIHTVDSFGTLRSISTYRTRVVIGTKSLPKSYLSTYLKYLTAMTEPTHTYYENLLSISLK